MKINDVEKLLGITKANIRFYEKEGLITPSRSENGYREYSETDVRLLKDIIILRKLGIPIQQIADILDGVMPLQNALQTNIQSLQREIKQLTGSLILCRQLQQEDARILDTDRYWDIIQEKENAGYQFQSLLQDYIHYVGQAYTESLNWFPFLYGADWKRPANILFRILIGAILYSLLYAVSFQLTIPAAILFALRNFAVWALIFFVLLFPIFLISKKDPKLAEDIKVYGFLLLIFLILGLVIYIFYMNGHNRPT